MTATTVLAQDSATAAGQATGSGTTAAPATAASQPAPDPPAPKPVTLTLGADFPTAYMFRGIFQEDQGFIMQPFVDVGIAAASGLTINAGLWNSFHSGPSGSDHEGGDRSAWYELDFYASATFQAGKVKPSVLYTSYTSPNDAFATVQELSPAHTRSTMIAFALLVINLLGVGPGPLITGMIGDAYGLTLGLVTSQCVVGCAFFAFLLAARAARRQQLAQG